MRSILLTGLLAIQYMLAAQTLAEPLGTRYQRLSVFAPSFSSAASGAMNPAALAQLKKASGSLSAERRFGLKALSVFSIQANMPLRAFSLGLSGTRGGDAGWRESSLQAALAKQLSERASVGISVGYMQLGNPVYGHAGAISAGAGFLWRLAPGLHAAIQISNPARPRIGKNGADKLPASFSIGIGWEKEGQWMLAAEMRKQGSFAPSVLAGLEYCFDPLLHARCGIDTSLPGAWLGVGTAAAGLRIDITVMLHRELGATPSITIQYPSK